MRRPSPALGTAGATALATCLLVTAAATQASTPRPVTVSGGGAIDTNVMQFGASSTRVLTRLPTNPQSLGYFDADAPSPSYVAMVSATASNASVGSALWERGNPVPNRAFYVTGTGTGPSGPVPRQLFSATGSGVSTLIGNIVVPATSDIRLDAITGNDAFVYLRDETTGNLFRMSTALGSTPVLIGTSGRSVRVSPNDTILATPAAPAGSTLQFRNATTGAILATRTLPLVVSPSGPVAARIESVEWLDDRYLVAILAPSNSPASINSPGHIYRIDRLDASAAGIVALTFPFTGTIQPTYSQLRISGDRSWITAVRSQINAPGGWERTVVAMRIQDGATTSPGGSLVVLDANENGPRFDQVVNPLIQQRPGRPLEPLVFFWARQITPTVSFNTYAASFERDIHVTTRAVLGATPTALNLAAHSSANDAFLVVWASLDRLNPPAPLPFPDFFGTVFLASPFVDALSIATPSAADVSATLTLAAGAGPVNTRFYLQPMWLNAPASGPLTYNFGRLVELPVF